MDLLKSINEWIQKGFEINYYIVNQAENGYIEDVLNGDKPNFTYTFSIHEMDEELFILSVDDLEEGFIEVLKFLENK
ncbi:hypothetical protein [Bacillus sp. FJAT-22090]|uniref:hypothetical protein n=1 Tax=Bacillus sp. FJAT-22090 TaxID=1581038 RepID=UPI00119FFABF|nr:hypothetical protein [Bacillus sp. FJAT-22090]